MISSSETATVTRSALVHLVGTPNRVVLTQQISSVARENDNSSSSSSSSTGWIFVQSQFTVVDRQILIPFEYSQFISFSLSDVSTNSSESLSIWDYENKLTFILSLKTLSVKNTLETWRMLRKNLGHCWDLDLICPLFSSGLILTEYVCIEYFNFLHYYHFYSRHRYVGTYISGRIYRYGTCNPSLWCCADQKYNTVMVK